MARRSGFGIFEAGTATGYVTGWCPHCGRRRGNDGRCADCDPWFTSPLVQYGGPIVGAFTVFLIVGAFVIGIGARSNANGSGTPAGILGAASVAPPAFPVNAVPQFPAVQSVALPMPKPPDPASAAASFAPNIYSPDARAYAEAENLRQTTAWTDWQVDNIRREQEQRERQPASSYDASPGLQSRQAMAQTAEVM